MFSLFNKLTSMLSTILNFDSQNYGCTSLISKDCTVAHLNREVFPVFDKINELKKMNNEKKKLIYLKSRSSSP